METVTNNDYPTKKDISNLSDLDKSGFVKRLLKLVAEYDCCSELYWNENLEFYIICNDLFAWACSDGEDIRTEDDLKLLEQSFKDSEYNGQLLYCARRRKCIPQEPYFKYFNKGNDSQLFRDACEYE